MSEIDRFYPWIEQTENGGIAAEMVKSPDGGYVGWDDYAKLLREYVYVQGQKQHYMDEAAKWLDTAAKNWQAYQELSDALKTEPATPPCAGCGEPFKAGESCPAAALDAEEQAIVDEVADLLAKKTVDLVIKRNFSKWFEDYTLTEAGYRAVMQQGAKLNGGVKAGED